MFGLVFLAPVLGEKGFEAVWRDWVLRKSCVKRVSKVSGYTFLALVLGEKGFEAVRRDRVLPKS